MDDSATQNRRDELECWLGRFLSCCEGAAVVEGEVVEAVITTLETCLPISEKTLLRPLPDPTELARTLQNRWA